MTLWVCLGHRDENFLHVLNTHTLKPVLTSILQTHGGARDIQKNVWVSSQFQREIIFKVQTHVKMFHYKGPYLHLLAPKGSFLNELMTF